MPIARLNGHDMYFEIHGSGEPLVCSGGWGTFCHGGIHHLPRGLTDRYRVVVFDHRGIGDSDDDVSRPATTSLYAADVVALMDHLDIGSAHLVGIVGIGACIFQEVAIEHPHRVRSLVNSGTWARADRHFRVQVELWLDLHRRLGFETFQREVVLRAFDPRFFDRYHDRLLGPTGPWSELRDNLAAHARLTDAVCSHDTLERLGRITAPALVVHAGRDAITGPHLSRAVEAGIPGAVGVLYPEAAHVLTERRDRDSFARRVMEFLAAA